MSLRLVADNPDVPPRKRYRLDRDPVAMALAMMEDCERKLGVPCPDGAIMALSQAISEADAKAAVLEALLIRARGQSDPDGAA